MRANLFVAAGADQRFFKTDGIQMDYAGVASTVQTLERDFRVLGAGLFDARSSPVARELARRVVPNAAVVAVTLSASARDGVEITSARPLFGMDEYM